MKHTFAFLLSLLLFFLMPISVYAAEFSAYSEGTRYNRIFTLEIYLRDESSFSGALLEVSYDPDILEFRGATSAAAGAEVDTYEGNGNVRVIFLSTDPLNCAEDTQIFGLDFISKAGGSGNFNIQIAEAVDGNADLIETNESFLCSYSVTEKSNGELSVSSTKSSNFKIKTSSNKGSKEDEAEAEAEENTSDTTDAYEPNVTPITLLERDNYPFVLALIIIIIISITVIAVRIIRLKIITKKKVDLKRKDSSEEN